MAKFCGNCGMELDDNARVCGKCGTPVDKAAANATSPKVVDPEKQKKLKKIIKKIFALVVVLTVLALSAYTVSQYTGCNGLLRKVMTAYEKYDIDAIISVSGDMYFYGEEDYVEQYFENIIGQSLDAFESAVGHSYKFSYEVNEIYTLSERKMDELLKHIEYTFDDFDIDTIQKISVADLTISAKQGSKSINRDVNIYMSKEGGKWRLLYIQ